MAVNSICSTAFCESVVLRQGFSGFQLPHQALPRQLSQRESQPSQAAPDGRSQIPPFVTCGDIFPRPGEISPLRGSFFAMTETHRMNDKSLWQCYKLPLRGSWHGASRD